jgi:hypothetical protein
MGSKRRKNFLPDKRRRIAVGFYTFQPICLHNFPLLKPLAWQITS